MADENLGISTMLDSTTEESDEVKAYFLSQSPKATVTFAQKVYAETIVGHRHDVWDLHADGLLGYRAVGVGCRETLISFISCPQQR